MSVLCRAADLMIYMRLFLYHCPAGCVIKWFEIMAVLHITYKRDRETSNADYDKFYRTITSYRSRRLSTSHWTIHTEEPPQDVWQKLKCHIDPNDYLLMLPLDPSWFSPKDRTLLSWLAAGP